MKIILITSKDKNSVSEETTKKMVGDLAYASRFRAHFICNGQLGTNAYDSEINRITDWHNCTWKEYASS